jgi:16S rRNA (guanine527-N7)-methyltransferase
VFDDRRKLLAKPAPTLILIPNPYPLMPDLDPLPNLDKLWQETSAWLPDERQQAQLQSLYSAVVAANRNLNLTRITAPAEFWEKHLWDSIRGVGDFMTAPAALRVVDLGTGAGFPGLPLAIARTDWQLTLVDSTAKKIGFVKTLVPELGLANVTGVVSRIEDLGQQSTHRQQYDLALLRAVANANVCAEYALPLVEIGGTAILYRGNWTEEEAAGLGIAVAKLGGEVLKVDRFTTPISNSIRHCIWLRKTTATHPYYPRAVGIPSQKPL